uniref:GINS subunit domain-containing protein n=1 Tax=Hyaloperonospora arabidopsidis (strain Emoy2) TaxID=559515 RepID=M4BLP6_HYAAE
MLKQLNKCRILAPSWFAPEDLDRSEHLRLLLEDLQNVRQDKIRNGLAKIAGDVQAGETAFVIQMNNISAMEINSVREFMLGSLDQFYRLSQLTAGAGAGEGDSQSQSQSQSQGYAEPASEGPAARRLRRHRGQ